MSIKTADVRRLALALVAALLLPSCGQAEQGDTPQQAATAPLQVAQAQPQARPSATGAGGSKPNIVVIWGDDVGITNISAFASSPGSPGFSPYQAI